MHTIDREAFETLVETALAALPGEFRERIENLTFAVEDHASPDDLRTTHTGPGHTLLGIYRGIPLTQRTSGYNLIAPDVIVLFKQPLERLARDLPHLTELVEHTVRHEVAHYFGISDQRLRDLGAY